MPSVQTIHTEAGTTLLSYVQGYCAEHVYKLCSLLLSVQVNYYNHRKSVGKDDLEIIFCSSDKTEAEFNEYFGTMPWLAMPLRDPRVEQLSSRLEVQGIPMFVIIDPAGEVVTTNGRAAVMGDPKSDRTPGFPYYPEAVEDLSESAECCGFDINSKPAVIVFMENADDDEQEAAKGVLGEGSHSISFLFWPKVVT